MTDYTDLKARLNRLADCDSRAGEPLGKCMREAAAAIDALEADIARLQTAHVQMQRAYDDLAAENARLREELSLIAVMGYGANAAEHEAIARLAVQRARAALTAPTSGC